MGQYARKGTGPDAQRAGPFESSSRLNRKTPFVGHLVDQGTGLPGAVTVMRFSRVLITV